MFVRRSRPSRLVAARSEKVRRLVGIVSASVAATFVMLLLVSSLKTNTFVETTTTGVAALDPRTATRNWLVALSWLLVNAAALVSVTTTVMLVSPMSPLAGIQEKTPLSASMVAPAGGFSREKNNLLVGRSES